MRDDWKAADGTVSGVKATSTRGGMTYAVDFTYQVDGVRYAGTFTGAKSYVPGEALPVRYDPANPAMNDIVEKETRKQRLMMAFALVVLLLFLALIAIWLRSR